MIYLLIILSFPSTYGGKGMYRVKSADCEWLFDARSILVVNGDAEGYRYEYPDTNLDFVSGRVGICYVPLHRLETYALWRVQSDGRFELPLDQSDYDVDIGDVDIGFKTVIKRAKNSYLSTDVASTLPIGRGRFSNDRPIIHPQLLGTLDLGDYFTLMPGRWHLNLGLPLGRRGASGTVPVSFGLAWELPSRFFTYFTEVSRNHERDWQWRFTPGLRFHPLYRVGITTAVDLGLVRGFRLLGINAGIALNSSLIREREVLPAGFIAGEVRDHNTGEPLRARISLIEIGEAAATDGRFGVYKIIAIPRGIYTVNVEAEDYTSESRVLVVEPGQTALANFSLKRSNVYYRGLIIDYQTARPVAGARLTIDGRTQSEAVTDETGSFQAALFPGEYDIKVNKENYVYYSRHELITDDRLDTIGLRPVELVGETPEAIVYFDVDDANIRDDQKSMLDNIAEFLKTHPRVKCELRGHADPSGNMEYNLTLSLARANSVMDYFVKVHGIEKDRIATLAFSKTKLVKEKKELSRRVEVFLVKE